VRWQSGVADRTFTDVFPVSPHPAAKVASVTVALRENCVIGTDTQKDEGPRLVGTSAVSTDKWATLK
jgi:hypothetical protein